RSAEIDRYRESLARFDAAEANAKAESSRRNRTFKQNLDSWKQYRRQTGEWPRRSIAFYFLETLLGWTAIGLAVPYAVLHHWSNRRPPLILLPTMLIYALAANRIGRKVRISEIARRRQQSSPFSSRQDT